MADPIKPRIGDIQGELTRQIQASVSDVDVKEAIAQWQKSPPSTKDIQGLPEGVSLADILSSTIEGEG